MKLVEEYIINLPDNYRLIILHLISVIEQELPYATLEFKWGIPYFYFEGKPFCYLAPSFKKKFVDVGFAKGYQLKNNLNVLIGENRNTVKSLRYFSLEEIDNEVLRGVITEAKTLYK